ncbi:MAG: hypothetical protein NTV48_03325 [Candidatus Vogelbacteria bacterium]|nr:hypothetical protein [Candidatus Vogelbacteria bacterium]
MNTVKFLVSIPFLFAVLLFGYALKVVKVLGNVILIALATAVAYLWGYQTPEKCPFVRGILLLHFTTNPDKETHSQYEH